MLDKGKLETMKYLKKEFNGLQNDPILSLGCTVGLKNRGDVFHWIITLVGPSDTPYAGGMFFLTADFPDNYPKGKPEVKFTNKIYHLNVSSYDGHICISTLNDWETNIKNNKTNPSMVDVISSIFALFYDQNPNSPYSDEMAAEYSNNREEFNRKAREWTKKYAPM